METYNCRGCGPCNKQHHSSFVNQRLRHAPRPRASVSFPLRPDTRRNVTSISTVSTTTSRHTVKKVTNIGLTDLPTLIEVADLVTQAFFDSKYQFSRDLFKPVRRLSHKVHNLMWNLVLHVARAEYHYTLFALDTANRGSKVLGTAGVTCYSVSAAQAEALGLEAGAVAAWVSNVSVRRAFRRQGVASSLLQECEAIAQRTIDSSPVLMCLNVFGDNTQAQRLYGRMGYRVSSWVDPLWLEAAEKGEMGPGRRLLMFKVLKSTVEAGMGAEAEVPQLVTAGSRNS